MGQCRKSGRARNFRSAIRFLFSLDRSNPKPMQATQTSSDSKPKVFTVRDQSCPVRPPLAEPQINHR